jgi:predicted ATPase
MSQTPTILESLIVVKAEKKKIEKRKGREIKMGIESEKITGCDQMRQCQEKELRLDFIAILEEIATELSMKKRSPKLITIIR